MIFRPSRRVYQPRRRYRGAGLIVVLFLFAGIGASGLLLSDSADYFERAKKVRETKDRQTLKEARHALLTYMLVRAESDLNIARGISGSVDPRLLMLPCPDNIGDENLDGSQDVVCGKSTSGNNLVNKILNGGSRFGRLPWRSRNVYKVSHSLNDGLDIPLKDAAGNRFWYALSRNMAPTDKDKNLPLNLHRLVTHDKEWLTVVNKDGGVMSNQVAAVILSPGQAKAPRQSEDVLDTATTLTVTEVNSPSGSLSPTRYFEEYALSVSPSSVVANYDTDGVFIQTARDAERGFDDALTYIDVRDLADHRHFFLHNYRRLIGVSEVHNKPLADRPLAQMATALKAYYALLGFYPSPAKQGNTLHVSSRQRHCSRYHSGAAGHAAALTSATPLMPATELSVYAAAGSVLTAAATVTLAQNGAFLLQQHAAATVAAVATVLYDDSALSVAALTLARYARINLPAGAVLALTAGGITPVSATVFRLSVAAAAVLENVVTVTIAPQTPLKPDGALLGWFAEHTLAFVRAGDDGDIFNLHGDTRAMFWSAAQLTSAVTTVTLSAADTLTLTAGTDVRFEQDFAQRQALAGEVFYQGGQTLTISSLYPTAATYDRRQFAVWLLADATDGGKRIEAPALLFPWRHEIGSKGANSRDNLHAYPPCFDARNFFGRRLQTAVQDQNVIYAVSEACHYGGDPADCGTRGGFTVSVAAGAQAALPQALAVTNSYTVTVGNVLTVALQNGVLQHSGTITILHRAAPLPLLADNGITLAVFRLTAGTQLVGGTQLTLPAETPLTGAEDTVFEQVQALMLYSPAPLPRVACTRGMPPGALAGASTNFTPPLALANQHAPAADITPLCYWLDDDENADGDNFYVIYAPETRRGVSPRNDYFMLFGGRLRRS